MVGVKFTAGALGLVQGSVLMLFPVQLFLGTTGRGHLRFPLRKRNEGGDPRVGCIF